MNKINKLLVVVLVFLIVLCINIGLVGCNNNCEHNVEYDGICTLCKNYIPTDGVIYQVSNDGEYAKVCGYEGTDSLVVISEEYEGLPVTTIETWAFDNCNNIFHIVLSDSITTLNIDSFNDCHKLTSIVLGKNVTSIHDSAFSGCFRLVEIYNKSTLSITANSIENGYIGYYAKNIYTEPNDSKLSTDEDGYVIYSNGAERELISYVGEDTNLVLPEDITKINGFAFYNMDKLESIVVGNQVTEIGKDAFAICDLLQTITIGDGVTSIESDAFAFCPNLSEIKLGKNLTTIGMWAFEGCANLENIDVADENASYTSIDGNLYTKDGKELLQYAIGKPQTTVTIPSHVTRIRIGAFRHCKTITDIIIGDSVLSVADFAFAYCENLTSISFGKNVNSISDTAFDHTRLLNITVDENNAKYVAENNVLYHFGSGIRYLDLYPARSTAQTFVVPDDVSYINRYAFEHCDYLQNVIISQNVVRIFGYAFGHCENLENVQIVNENTIIDENAFYQCAKLNNNAIL